MTPNHPRAPTRLGQPFGAAEFQMPSLAPPQPVTHTWILPSVLAQKGLIWKREAGWNVFTPPAISLT